MKELPPAPEEREAGDAELIEFGEHWERASELRSVIQRLPGELVLKSGQSGRRNALLERWDALETPGLDGEIPEGALEQLDKWIHEAEVLISYIVKIGRESRSPRRGDGRVYSAPQSDPGDLPQVIESIEEAEFIEDDWCWPWPDRTIAKAKPKWDKGKLIKFGAVAGIGVMALMTYLDEE